MNRIIALTFIGILMSAFANDVCDNTICKYKVMENFDSTKLLEYSLSGPLYLTLGKTGVGIICLIYTFTKNSNDDVIVNSAHSYVKNNSGGVFDYKMVCNNTKDSFDKGVYFGDCKIADERYITKEWSDDAIVVATDYQNYVLLYSCYKSETGYKEYIQVLQKDPEFINDCNNPVEGALKSLGIELKELDIKNTTYCQKENKDDKKET